MKRAGHKIMATDTGDSLPARGKSSGKSKASEESNELAVILASLRTMRDGDFTARLPGTWTGLAGKVADTFNEIVATEQHLLQEIQRVGMTVGKQVPNVARTWKAELHKKNQQLEQLNTELEERVLERTQELERKAGTLQRLNSELAQKNQELDAIVHTAPDIIFSRQSDGARDYISSRFYEYTGAAPGSAIGFGWLEYVYAEDHERTLEHWVRCVRSGEDYESEYRLRGADGRYRWFRARAVPLRDSQGTILKWYGTCSDIHDSKLLEQSIRDSAIELERMVDGRTAELRRLSSRLMTMQDEERRRIAREIHDGLGQELAAAKMIMDGILCKGSAPGNREAAADASQMLDRAIQQVRTISHLLHPPLLDEVGLVSAIRWYLEGLSERSGMKICLSVDPPELCRLKPELETAIFRIIQEALTNVYRHSGARNGLVSLREREGNIVVTVRDDGRGIEEQVIQLRPESVGVGIGGMRQRVAELGGSLRLANANPGAIVEVVIPSRRLEPAKLPLRT